MSSFILKMIAIISMLIDHSGYILFHGFSFLNYIGRISFPIFAFQISEGYKHTRDVKKYFLRLLIFAFISQIPYMLFEFSVGKGFSFNVLFTLSLGLLSIILYDKQKNKFLGFILVYLIAIFASLFQISYGAFGIIIIFIFHLFKDKKGWMTLCYLVTCFLKYLPSLIQYQFYYKFIILCICTMLPIIFILFYNEKKGKDIKYLLYLFYPLHLLVLFLIHRYL